jgi:DMSO/TMAO reductase YedYZ molybdopterin-dependent catalytic subunit
MEKSNRRSFIQKSILGIAAVAGSPIVFAKNLPKNSELIGNKPFEEPITGKHKDMILLGDKPINLEAQAHLLDDDITPFDKMFIRNNGNAPTVVNEKEWKLEIAGESVVNPTVFSLDELKTKFKTHTYQLVLECGGNGRSGYSPTTSGNQWTEGGVSCAEWTGVRLRDVLESVGVKSDAVYIGYYGKDIHLSGDANKVVISRGVPIQKAMEEEVLLAWEMNGQPIPMVHGFPLRLVVGGYPASVSGKWLSKIVVRNIVHDGPKMEGHSYRVPKYSVEPGTKVPDEDMKIIESMPVKSLVTYPRSGAIIKEGTTLNLRGQAWAGDLAVKAMEISIDFGATWQKCDLKDPKNRHSWQRWETDVQFPQKGYYEVWAKATDTNGIVQPMVIPAWNPGGYINNACHRIAVKVT